MSARLALIIGNKEYDDPILQGLRAPGYDVNDLAKVLEDPRIGGFKVVRLLDRSFAEVRSAISDFLSDGGPDDTLLIYFSGHGIRSRWGTVYLAVRDTRQKNPAALGIDAHFLRTEMQQCYCHRQILILDCCYSGAFAKFGEKGVDDEVDTRSEFMGGGFGQVVITATNAVQVGIEADRVVDNSKYSLFTHYLIEGLRTGDADGAGSAGGVADGIITDLELYEYAYQRVDRTKEQVPQRLVQQSGLAIELARNPAFDRMSQELRDLVRLAKSSVRTDRANAARAFGDFLAESDADVVEYARKALTALLADTAVSVRQAAQEALRTGQTWPTLNISPPLSVPEAQLVAPHHAGESERAEAAARAKEEEKRKAQEEERRKAKYKKTLERRRKEERQREQDDKEARERAQAQRKARKAEEAHRKAEEERKEREAGDPTIHGNLGNSLYAKRDWDGAVEKYREALRIKPEYADVRNGLGNALNERGNAFYAEQDWDGAIRDYREALELKPHDVMIHGNLGNSLYAKRDWDGAIEEYGEALRLKPDYADARNGLGNALNERGNACYAEQNWEGAIRDYGQALRLKPNAPAIHGNLGNSLDAKGDWDGAIEEYREALRLKPDYADARNWLRNPLKKRGKAFYDREDWDRAIQDYREALQLRPDDTTIHGILASVEQKAAERDRANKQAEAAAREAQAQAEARERAEKKWRKEAEERRRPQKQAEQEAAEHKQAREEAKAAARKVQAQAATSEPSPPVTYAQLLTLSAAHTAAVRSVAWCPNGERLATAGRDGRVKVWDAESFEELLTLRALVWSVVWSPDGKYLATGDAHDYSSVVSVMSGRPSEYQNHAHVYDATSGTLFHVLRGHRGFVLSVAWHPNGERLATGSADKTAKVWDTWSDRVPRELLTLNGHRASVLSVAWSPDGERLATGSKDNTAKVWDAECGKELLTLSGHSYNVVSVAWCPAGKRLATGSEDCTAKVWDAETARHLLTLAGHRNSVYSVAWSPDGKWLATGSGDKTAKVWDAETGKQLLTLPGHRKWVGSVD